MASMDGLHLQRNYYLLSYRTPTTDDIEQAVDVEQARRLRTRGELRSIPGSVAASFKM